APPDSRRDGARGRGVTVPAPAEVRLEQSEEPQDDEHHDENEEQVDPVAAVPRRAGRDRGSGRVPPPAAEVAEEPQQRDDDDEELEQAHAYLHPSVPDPGFMSGRFADWVSTADAVRATTKKLEKLALLGGYFRQLEDADLAIAARLYAGVPFPRTDERVLSVGWSILLDGVIARSGATGDDVAASYQRHADLGDVAAELTERSATPTKPPPLTLGDVAESFDRVAATRGVAPKRELLEALLARATAAEVRYVVKVMSGEPRIGLREGLLEDAVARAFGREREAVGRAHMLGGDIGVTAVQARNGTLDEARFVHFAPIGMMLATPVLDLIEVEKRFPPPYVVEDKYDGVRAQVHKEGDRVELYSRTFDRVTARFPELIPPLLALPGTFVLDAEVLAFDPEGRAIPFTRFQHRLGRKVVS